MSESPLLGLNIDAQSSVSLFEHLYEALRNRITSEQFLAGTRLPSSRRLAEELGISRTTVITAYNQLVDEGFAYSRPCSGIYVSEIGSLETLEPAPLSPPTENVRGFVSKRLKPFYPGLPDDRLFPYSQWARCVARTARNEPETLARVGEPFGDRVLRQEICRYLADWRGVKAVPDQVLITAGAGDSLELCIRTLAGQQDKIAMEDPGYPPLRTFVKSLGMPLVYMNMDERGAQVPSHDKRHPSPRLVVLTPSSQFPLGGAMPQIRRTEFIDWATRNDSWIIEDDYDSEFRYAGRPIPALAALDTQQRTLYIGTFTKVFSSGLRLGFIVLPPRLVTDFQVSIDRHGTRASIVPQRPLGRFMGDGGYYRHIRRARKIYSERRSAFIQLLETQLGNRAIFTDHKAGMQLAVQFNGIFKDQTLVKLALANGVHCKALSSYYASSPQQGLLVGFSGYTIDEMAAAMPLLKKAVDNYQE